MSESILKALVQLFALIARAASNYEKNNAFLDSLLRQHLSPRLIENYKELYVDYLNYFSYNIPASTDNSVQNIELLTSQAEKVCFQIRKELHAVDRIVVVIKFLELVNEDNIVTSTEEAIIDTIFRGFSIHERDAKHLKCFVVKKNLNNIDPQKRITISKNSIGKNEVHNAISSEIEGRIDFLYLDSVDFFVAMYSGGEDLYLDGSPMPVNKPVIFEMGGIIRSKEANPIYFSDIFAIIHGQNQTHKITFEAENLTFRFRNSSNGIQTFSFSETKGQLIGIMGGSGVGKSTLLNLLTGKLKPLDGDVLINGHSIYTNRHSIQGLIGYVPQDDLLFENLTVFQNLYYNAKLCFSHFSEDQIQQTVKRVLYDLDLWEIKDLKVGTPLNKTISGGQRKRLNFGLEFMREPSILFVDEPTSGLSSSDSLNIMKLLKQQASNGRLIIVNIHQPSSKVFRLIDKLWVLDKGGYPIYAGNPTDAIVYFKTLSTQVNSTESGCPQCGTINPDQILELVEAKCIDEEGRQTVQRKKNPQEWYDHYRSKIQRNVNPQKIREPLPKNFFNIPNVQVQFQVFSARNLLSKLANKQYIFISLLEAPLLAFILAFFSKHVPGNSYVFADNKNFPSFLLMSIIVALFIGLTVSAEEIISDRKILERETFLNLSRFSYLNAKVLYLFGLSAIQMLLFVLVGNSILEIKGMMFSHWLILFSTACFANIVGLNLSAGLSSVVAIYISIPFVLVPQILLSGTIVQFDNLHPSLTKKIYVPVVGDLMVSRWAYEALAVEQFKNNTFQRNFFYHEQVASQAHFRTSFLIPRLQNTLDECVRLIHSDDVDIARLSKNLSLLQKELTKISKYDSLPPFEYLSRLKVKTFDEGIADEVKAYLIFVRLQFTSKLNNAREVKDSIYTRMVRNFGLDEMYTLRKENHNKALSDWVLNTNDVNKYLETPNEVIQKFEPIFMLPTHRWGRAHFYAPFKMFNNQYVDTLWFNLSVIWLGVVAFFISLQVNVIGKILNYFENLLFVRKENKRVAKNLKLN